MKILSRVILISLFFLLFPLRSVLSENLLIVEVQIAGEKSSNDFIKIYNPLDQNLDISGYKFRKRTSTGSESSIRVFPSGSKILSKNYFLWANSKDGYYLKIGANVWSTATLANNNSIALFNPEGKILDALAWGKSQNPFVENSPFPENPGPNQKLERKQIAGVYQDTNNNRENFYLNPPLEPSQSKTEIFPEERPKMESKEEITESKSEKVVIINEILPNTAVGIKDEEGEYIEIFNQNNFEVDLSNWKIEDVAGKITTFILPQGTKISPKGFLVFFRPTTKITLNNDGDGLNLIQPDGKIVDSVSYEKALSGQSYNRIDSKWIWSSLLTPGSENIGPTQKAEESETLKEPGKIDINTALLKDLVKIIHIGEARAEKLISLRPFYSLDDLKRIKGIGDKALEEIKKQGLAWVDPKLKPAKPEKTEPLEKGLATVAAAEPMKFFTQDKKIPKFLSIFLIALAIAISSGIIILILKRKIKV